MKGAQLKIQPKKVNVANEESLEEAVLRREKIYEAYLRVYKPESIKEYDDHKSIAK